MIRIVVASKDTGSYSKEYKGKVYVYQNAAIFAGGDFPLPFQVNVEKGHEYEPGDYTIDPKSFRVDDRQNLTLRGVKLLPIAGSSAGIAGSSAGVRASAR